MYIFLTNIKGGVRQLLDLDRRKQKVSLEYFTFQCVVHREWSGSAHARAPLIFDGGDPSGRVHSNYIIITYPVDGR